MTSTSMQSATGGEETDGAVRRNARGVPVPRHIHQIRDDIKESTRVIVVGDVHGCYEELRELLVECGYLSPSSYTVLDASLVVALVGDLICKGPQSLKVVRFAREHDLLVLRGNKDDDALKAYYAWKKEPSTALPDAYRFMEEFAEEDIHWLESLAYVISLPAHNAILVHAGLVPGLKIEDQNLEDLYEIRSLVTATETEGSSMWTATSKGNQGVPWASQWPGPQHVFFGHDAKRGLQRYPFATGLDTGCCWGFQLTAIILPEKRFVAVKAKQAYKLTPSSGAQVMTPALLLPHSG